MISSENTVQEKRLPWSDTRRSSEATWTRIRKRSTSRTDEPWNSRVVSCPTSSFTPDRTSTVLLVFDASAQGRDGKSLNYHLEKGTNYIDSLPNVFIAWCFDKEAYTGDVRKMFNQVKIHPDDQVFHHFLWRTKDTEQPRVYRWLRLNFGDKPAPDIAAATINTPAKASEAHGFPWTKFTTRLPSSVTLCNCHLWGTKIEPEQMTTWKLYPCLKMSLHTRINQ